LLRIILIFFIFSFNSCSEYSIFPYFPESLGVVFIFGHINLRLTSVLYFVTKFIWSHGD